MLKRQMSAIFFPPTRTARLCGFSLEPLHAVLPHLLPRNRVVEGTDGIEKDQAECEDEQGDLA